jgi:hypothetical protein
MTGGEYAPSPGVVYPTLAMLQDMGLIEEPRRRLARKPFQITDSGTAASRGAADEADDLMERLTELAPDERAPGPAIARAVKNFMTALSHRIGRDGLDEDLLHESPQSSTRRRSGSKGSSSRSPDHPHDSSRAAG